MHQGHPRSLFLQPGPHENIYIFFFPLAFPFLAHFLACDSEVGKPATRWMCHKLQYLLRNLGHRNAATPHLPPLATASVPTAPEVSLDLPPPTLSLLVRQMARGFGEQSGCKRQCSDGHRAYDAGPCFPLLEYSQQVQSDFSHDNLCSVTLGKTAPTSVSWCPHTRATQLKHLVCLLEGGEGGDNIHT